MTLVRINEMVFQIEDDQKVVIQPETNELVDTTLQNHNGGWKMTITANQHRRGVVSFYIPWPDKTTLNKLERPFLSRQYLDQFSIRRNVEPIVNFQKAIITSVTPATEPTEWIKATNFKRLDRPRTFSQMLLISVKAQLSANFETV